MMVVMKVSPTVAKMAGKMVQAMVGLTVAYWAEMTVGK